MRLAVVFLAVQVAFAQHSGGFARGNVGRGAVGGRAFPSGRAIRHFDRGLNRPFGSTYAYPYGSLLGDYGLLGGYPYLNGDLYPENGEESSPPPNMFFAPPPTGMAAQPAQPARPVQAVVHEYAVPHEPGENEAGTEMITIALKDGTQRSTVATWVQGGKLHYLDSDGKQQALSAELIDRRETQRLNREKRLQVELPPG